MERAYFGPHRRAVAVISQGMLYDENDDPASAIAALRLGLDVCMKHGSGNAEPESLLR
jgi:hypothetical protein